MKTIQKFWLCVVAIILFAANANAGRWLTRDPIEFMERDPKPAVLDSQQQINLYAYVGNNPVSRVDPLGLYWLVSETPFPGQEGQYGPYAAWVPGGGDRVYYWDPNFYNDGPIQDDPWGEMLLPGGGWLMAPAKGFTVCAAKGVLNPNIYSQLEKQLAKDGAASVQQALRSATKTLAEHEAKLQQILKEGGYPSQVETTIRNVKNQIETLKQFIKDKGL